MNGNSFYVSIGRDAYSPKSKAIVFIVQKMSGWNTRHGVFFRTSVSNGKRAAQFTIHAFGRRVIDLVHA